MVERLDQAELRRRAIDGVRDEVEAFGSSAPRSRLIRLDGLLAAVTPATPERSLFNSVYYSDPDVLADQVDALRDAYESEGIRAWTVFVPDHDRETARLLASRGHLLDAAPRAMALELTDLADEPPRPDGVERVPGDAVAAAALNDRAYGYEGDGFRGAITGESSIRWHGAMAGGELVGCVGAIEVGDDCLITGVATPPEHQGRGIAGWLLWSVLDAARGEGMRSGSLQATKAGAPLYERLGFADHGYLEMWELRK